MPQNGSTACSGDRGRPYRQRPALSVAKGRSTFRSAANPEVMKRLCQHRAVDRTQTTSAKNRVIALEPSIAACHRPRRRTHSITTFWASSWARRIEVCGEAKPPTAPGSSPTGSVWHRALLVLAHSERQSTSDRFERLIALPALALLRSSPNVLKAKARCPEATVP